MAKHEGTVTERTDVGQAGNPVLLTKHFRDMNTFQDLVSHDIKTVETMLTVEFIETYSKKVCEDLIASARLAKLMGLSFEDIAKKALAMHLSK